MIPNCLPLENTNTLPHCYDWLFMLLIWGLRFQELIKLFITFVPRRVAHCSAWIISFPRKWNNFRGTILQFQSNDFTVINSVFFVVLFLKKPESPTQMVSTDRLTVCCITWLITNYWSFLRLLPFEVTSWLIHTHGGRCSFICWILWRQLTVLLSVIGLARRQMCLFPAILNECVCQLRTKAFLI